MRLLLVEDHPELSHWLQKALTHAGFAVDVANDGVAADHLLQNENYALVVLDVALPRLNGLDLLARLRKRGQTLPVLLLTARTEVADRVKGLNLGADDYLTKPFEMDELEARIRALLRRSVGGSGQVVQFGDLTYHDEGYFLLANKPLALTPRESAVLTSLMHRRGRPVAKQQLFEQVFTLSDDANPESIELYVHRVRKKLHGSNVSIQTLRGLGYSLECTDGAL
ncbi:DNA-binding transcriptional regulator BasR [Yersinia frederiksenii]|uniref:transcriptional regulator TctD n=1 Tax=Yersinia alsatica TaxID=2890317 RepID=UPI0005DFB75F|nr:transcriptional regulator TctD [Yersinia alsatica]OVZ91826.1 DNA-binding response regulator [Yersinia frederiksenii]CFQ40916.1 DNA-binding transcriptional regulator BasR [Yersinia frederiksenii]CNH20089.1 DNA-binding transcriptional regulator BasR [Yersinia frederiksenii]CNH93010.1 DNA-binding transcriptional regulator BasR [Yersinia frederiksenii]CNI16462.1 DNA-binding transcriptional regulator BasR [Yersinia frederiksenii]